MKLLFHINIVITFILAIPALAQCNHASANEEYHEQMIIRSLDRGQISAYLQFKTFVATNLNYPYGVNAGKHNDIFPLSIVRVLHKHELQELHLSLTKGTWKYDRWGLPPNDVSPNAHLWAWFRTYLTASENWIKLTSFLAGQFCTSISLIKPSTTIRPKRSFQPLMHSKEKPFLSNIYEYGYLSALPQEAICTENLTPWAKLLPCRNRQGLGHLLTATSIFNSQFTSMTLDFQFSCSDINQCQQTQGIELVQKLLIVFNAPLVLDGRYSWTLNSLFSNSIPNHCLLAHSSHVYVETTHLKSINNSRLTIKPTDYVQFNDESSYGDGTRTFANYDLKRIDIFNGTANRKKKLNIGITYPSSYDGRLRKTIFNDFVVRRNARGYGLSQGGSTVSIENKLSNPINVLYLDMIPWNFRMYLHTLKIETYSIDSSAKSVSKRIKPKWLHYVPGKNRERPHHLELMIQLPARSVVDISFEFDIQFLRWTEYPPDANHGMYINPATITFFMTRTDSKHHLDRHLPKLLDSITNGTIALDDLYRIQEYIPLRFFTKPILIAMPTPDFSMPYNVVCLVSTVLSIAFGPIYNITTRRTLLLADKKKNQMENVDNNDDDDDQGS